MAATLRGVVGEDAPELAMVFVPPYGSDNLVTGRVANVDAATHAVAVYIFVDGWWTKPTFDAPLSPIGPDGRWTCDVTTGADDRYATLIAAYLVPAAYDPPRAAGWPQLPESLASNALAVAREPRPYTRRIRFSGTEWSVKESRDRRAGPGGNFFSDSDEQVWLDELGRLHLRITRRDSRWYCAEVVSVRSFGHGTYRVILDSDADALDPNAVLGLFTWYDDAPHAHREIDVEISRWTQTADTNNAQFVVQPWNELGHLARFRVPPSVASTTYTFAWRTGRVDFAAHIGAFDPLESTNETLFAWTYDGPGVPPAGGEQFRMNLWLADTNGPSDGAAEEVVVRRFVFVPDPVPPPAWTPASVESTGEFAANLSGEPNLACRIEVSTNLMDWRVASTAETGDGVARFADTNAPAPARFDRAAVPCP